MQVNVSITKAPIQNTYYVDATGGNDSNDGKSSGAAWQTLAKVNAATLNPGESVLLKCGETWKNEGLVIPSSGTAGHVITFGKYGTGANPVIDASVRYTDWVNHSGAIYKRTDTGANASQAFEDNVRMTYSASVGAMAAGSYCFASNVMYVWCSDDGDPNTGHVIEYCGSTAVRSCVRLNGQSYLVFDGIDGTKYDIAAYNTDVEDSTNITIKNCTVSWGNRAFLIGVTASGTSMTPSDITIQNVIGHDDLDVAFWIGHGTRLYVLDCESYYMGKDVAPGVKNYPYADGKHYPNGILVSAEAVDCIVRGCYVHDCYLGDYILDEKSGGLYSTGTIIERNHVEVTGSVAGIKIDGTNTIVRNNWVHAATYLCLTTGNGAASPLVYNNTFISDSGANNSFDAASLAPRAGGWTFKNNVFVRAGSTGRYVAFQAAAKPNAVMSNNLYYGSSTGRWFWGPTEYTSLASWQAASSLDADSMVADPVFVTANTNPHLQVTSPCIAAGATGLVTDDYDGVDRGAANDIGAFEYVA